MAKRIPVTAPAMPGPGTYVSLYLDHRSVGCGWHRYLVIRLGSKWVRLLSTENADGITIPRKDFNPTRIELKPTRIARRLRGIAQDYGLEKSEDVRKALSLLRAQAPRRS